MAETLAAVGLASNVLQFVDFAYKLISASAEIFGGATGSVQENNEIDVVTRDLQGQISILIQAFKSSRDPDLSNLLQDCMEAATELHMLVESLQLKPGKRGHIRSVVQAIRVLRKKGKITNLETRINRIRDGIMFHLNVILL